jgi:hypothetical protein
MSAAMRVRHTDGRTGTIAADAEPDDGPMGDVLWTVLWDDGTTTAEDDDELEIVP